MDSRLPPGVAESPSNLKRHLRSFSIMTACMHTTVSGQG